MTDNRFTQSAQVALMQAFSAAKRLQHNYIGSEHILLGLFQEPSGQAYRVLREMGLPEDGLAFQVARQVGSGAGPGGGNTRSAPSGAKVTFSDEATAIIESAACQAALTKTPGVATEHLLLAIASHADCTAAIILRQCGIAAESLRRRLSAQNAAPHGSMPQQPYGTQPQRGTATTFGKRELKLTLQYGIDMTQRAALGGYDPVVGRDRETERLVQVLTRRQKSNPVLLGDAGVGKTAIVENLAALMAGGTVPSLLTGRRIISLDLAGMISGTKYRGEFEERTRQIIEEVRAVGNVILFIDEMHMIAGAGAAEGAIDAANIMKPALSRGHIQVIGATTTAEYKKYIRRDSALARRFQPVEVAEPTSGQAVTILKALRPKYERHHSVKIDDSAIQAAIELSGRYIQDRRLPDKAIDLMDEASAYAVLRHRFHVQAGDVRDVLCQSTGVEVGQLDKDERSRLLRLPAELRRAVIGQDEAVDAVARAVRRARAFGGQGRPASFLFCGPSGVGKTQLARTLAKVLFGSEQHMIRLDMSEFMEKHSVARLIGSPPGYVGFGEGGQLTEKIRRTPYSVVLLDEVEKAHPDVLNILLQVLEDGLLTDGEGERVSFQSAMIIMTSNVGLERLAGARRTGFGAASPADLQGDVMAAVRKSFRTELINRIDQIAVFQPLALQDLTLIATRELELLAQRLEGQGVLLEWEPEAVEHLVTAGSDPAMGARPFKRAITARVEDPVAQMWLEEGTSSAFKLTCHDGELKVISAAAPGRLGFQGI